MNIEPAIKQPSYVYRVSQKTKGPNFTIDMTRGLGLGLGSSSILKVRFFGTPCTLCLQCCCAGTLQV